MLVDPESLDDLEKMGGISGLLDGLGVDGTKGLLVGGNEGAVEVGNPRDGPAVPPPNAGPQWNVDIEKRREIYGHNDLPERKSKSLLMLMWLAFKDKVLVCLVRSGRDHVFQAHPLSACLDPAVSSCSRIPRFGVVSRSRRSTYNHLLRRMS